MATDYNLINRDKNNNQNPVIAITGQVSVKQPGTIVYQNGVTTDEHGNIVPVSGDVYLKKDDTVKVIRVAAGHLIKTITAVIVDPYNKNTTMKVTDSNGDVLFASLNASDTVCKTTVKELNKYVDTAYDITVEITAMADQATSGQVILVVDGIELGVQTYMFG